VARASDRRTSFTKAARSPSDTGRRVDGLNFVWRNGSAIELRPARALTLRWDVSSLRDLREYGDRDAAAAAATAAREEFLGQDVGLERERIMRSSVAFAPLISAWIRPRIDLGSDFTMTRDPNSRSLLPGGELIRVGNPVWATEAVEGTILPRRFSSSQTLGAGATIDIATGLRTYLGRIPLVSPIAGIFAPVDVRYTRSLLSSFDRATTMAPLSYQFGMGGVDDFRSQDGQLATSAGVTNALTITNSLSLPVGLSLQNRFQRTDSRNWTRRLENQHSVIDGSQRTFPDLNLLWNWRPPAPVASFLSSVGARAGLRRTSRSTLVPAFTVGSEVDHTSDRSVSYPLNVSFAWEMLGGFTTGASYNVTRNEIFRPGSIGTGNTHEYGAEIGKVFAPRRAWRLPGDLHTRIGFQRSQNESRVLSLASGISSRLTDNGRYTFNLGADTEVSETISLSFTGSRTVTFDENFNRRFTQTVISAVMHLQFFGGNLR
jgi:hypothetical protein